MSVWKSDEKLLIFASLISPSKIILFEKSYQAFDTVFHHQMKDLEVSQKYSAPHRSFNSLLSVSSGDETLHFMPDILLHTHFQTRDKRGDNSKKETTLLGGFPNISLKNNCQHWDISQERRLHFATKNSMLMT